MRPIVVTACLLTLLAGPLGCAHWAPLTDHAMQAEVDPPSAYAAVLKVASERHYTILEQRDAERSVKLRAHIDENRSDHPNFINAQVDPSGRVTLTPAGSLVRGNTVHPKLASEVNYFQDALSGELKRPAGSATASAVALPPPPPPLPPTEPAPAPPPPVAAPSPAPATKPASANKPAPTPAKTPAPKSKPAGGDDWQPVK